MTTRLQIYNAALRNIGETRLSSLSENREPRRVMDGVWDDGFLDAVLEQGYWKFACRTVRIQYDPDVTTDFGYQKAFAKPDDYVKVCAVCSDEYLQTPLLQYTDEGDYWYADLHEIYVQYISKGKSYGYDLTKWPETFSEYAGLYMASQIVERLTQSASKEEKIRNLTRRALIDARSKDAIKEPTKFFPTGQWARARGGNRGSGNDRGNRGGLIG